MSDSRKRKDHPTSAEDSNEADSKSPTVSTTTTQPNNNKRQRTTPMDVKEIVAAAIDKNGELKAPPPFNPANMVQPIEDLTEQWRLMFHAKNYEQFEKLFGTQAAKIHYTLWEEKKEAFLTKHTMEVAEWIAQRVKDMVARDLISYSILTTQYATQGSHSSSSSSPPKDSSKM